MTTTTKLPTERASASIGESNAESGPGSHVTLETAAKLLLGRLPENISDWSALGKRIGMAGRKEPYNAYYMRNMMNGHVPYTDEVRIGIKNLISEILAEPPDVDYQNIIVKVANGFDVPEGTIIQRSARTCVCGVSFVPTAWNQINHTKACARMQARMKKRTR